MTDLRLKFKYLEPREEVVDGSKVENKLNFVKRELYLQLEYVGLSNKKNFPYLDYSRGQSDFANDQK